MPARSSLHKAFGIAVRELRDERGISQEELAHRSGLHRTYVGGVERGERNPTIASLQRLAGALGMSVSALLACAERLEHGEAAKRAS